MDQVDRDGAECDLERAAGSDEYLAVRELLEAVGRRRVGVREG